MNNFDYDLVDTLYTKYQDNTLASLYLITYPTHGLSAEEWVQEFIKKITPLADHPDILKIYKDDKASEYKVDSTAIKSFLHFINYHPIKLSKKFIFIFDAQDLSVTVSNKLLKIFEELGNKYCLFLMASHDAFILPTVLSRAVKLKIGQGSQKSSSENLFPTINTPQELIAHLKATKEDSSYEEKKFIEAKIDELLTNESNESFVKLSRLLNDLRDYEHSATFNNAKISRLTTFFS